MAESFYTDADLTGASANFDASNLTLGDALEFDVSGTVTHIRFRSTPVQSGGSYIGALYQIGANDPPGAPPSPLGQATYGPVPGDAWETVALSPPIAVAANTPYRPAFFTSVARYMTRSGFHSGGSVKRGHITSLGQGATSGGFTVRNGVFKYATGLNFPSDDAGGTSFLVDVVFVPDEAADPAEGTIDVGLDLSVATSGATDHEGSAALGVAFAPAAAGATDHAGAVALGLGLAVASAGLRDSSAAGALGLNFAVAATGDAPAVGAATGTVALGLDLAVAATGARGSAGSAALGLPLAVAVAGRRDAAGATALGLSLAVVGVGSDGSAALPRGPWIVDRSPASVMTSRSSSGRIVTRVQATE